MRRAISVGLVWMLMLAACSDDDASTSSVAESTSTTVAPTTTTTVTPIDPRTPVLLDYSPTVSDVGALAFVASHPDLRLVAVTLPGTGESYCEPGVAHTRGLLEAFDLGDVPVACGPDEPMTGWNAFPTSWRVGSNQIDLPEAEPNETRSAPELITELLSSADVPIEILAVGPLTNLALALVGAPDLTASIAGITIMGGAVDVPGNVFRNEVGEWNIWVDPTAAGIVFSSGAPITLVPLDATNDLPANPIFFEALDAAASGPASTVVRDLIAGDDFWLAGGFFFWDELAAAVLVDDSIVEFETRTLVVDDDLRENKGWTREDPTGSEIRVAVSADRRAFEQLYIDTLVGSVTALPYLAASNAEIEYFEELSAASLVLQGQMDLIFEQATAGMDDPGDDAFLAVVGAVLPDILDGPWVEYTDVLMTMNVPSSVSSAHQAYVERLTGFASARDAAIEALVSNDAEGFEALFSPVAQACSDLIAAAEQRLIDGTGICF